MDNFAKKNKEKRILFRADGNPDIGAGHIMRCLSIADTGSEYGFHCFFITAGDRFETVITSRGYKDIVLHSDYRNMSKELILMDKIIRDTMPSVLFVDSYFVSYAYLSNLKKICEDVECELVYIDDVAAFPYPCDILLNYNIYGLDKEQEYKQMYQKAKKEVPVLLLGTAYVPLRCEFQNLSGRIVKECATDILISTGGADSEHVARKIAEYIVINNCNLRNFHFHFIIGAMNPDKDEIRRITGVAGNITLYHNLKSISRLMRKCDLAISAAGSTLYELCATQTPTVTYILADNQILGAKKFVDYNILYCLGDVRRWGSDLAKELIDRAVSLAKNPKERVRIVQLQQKIVDGNGAYRIIKNLIF